MTIGRYSRVNLCRFATVILPLACLIGLAPAIAAGQNQEIASAIRVSTKMGEIKGNAYYYKPAGSGVGQIFKVPSSSPTSGFTAVGTIINGKYVIAPAEKSDFFALVTDKPASAFSGGAPGPPTSGPMEGSAGSSEAAGFAGCPASQGAYYSSGSGWMPMTMVDLEHGRGTSIKAGLGDMARNPFNPMAGRTNIMTLTNPAAHVTVGADPKFCMAIPVSISTDNIVIGNLDVKGDHREIESALSAKNSTGTWVPAKRVHKVNVERISDRVVLISPQDPLPPGQYVLAGSATTGVGTYDFGVE